MTLVRASRFSGLAAVAALALLATALWLSAAPRAAADTPTPIFYNITTDDDWAAGMALAQANIAASRGHQVTVFLNVRGVLLAKKGAEQEPFGPMKKTPAELLQALIAKKQTVMVCGTCMGVAGLKKEALIDGAAVSTPDDVFAALTAPGAIALSY